MKMWKVVLPVVAVLLLAGQAVAQVEEERMREAEAREAEMDRQLMEAEQRMAEAARQIAEITSERLPRMAEIERRFEFSDKPRLGVTIDGGQQTGPVEGVTIMGVSPGSAAGDAGLRAGDVMTAINDESLSAENAEEANTRLLDFMKGVETGDVLKVEYLRDGKVGSVEVEPRVVESNVFVWQGDDSPHFTVPGVPHAPHAPAIMERFTSGFGFSWAGSGLGELEMVELSEGLGRYFGTDSGLLVISAPKSDAFELQDGDVIQSIDGREPKDVRHAMRILSSYQSGEKLKLGIMRDKKKRTLDIEIPADRRGSLFDSHERPVRPAKAPLPPKAPAPDDVTTRT
ncbi:MAG: PDZ domain-containing protein [Gammaproteobacteria bacterium]|nr:PDZ domain-containing protein [Gammaproteobacteria bacterium]